MDGDAELGLCVFFVWVPTGFDGCCDGLDCVEDLLAVPLLVQDVFEGLLACGVGEVGDGRDVAEGWV